MRTVGYIHNRIKEIGIKDSAFRRTLFGTKREIDELSKLLKEDESLDFILSGFEDGSSWLIALTDRRLMLLNKGFVSLKKKELMLDKISAVNIHKGLIQGKVFIEDAGAKTMTISQIYLDDIDGFVEAVNDNVRAYKDSL